MVKTLHPADKESPAFIAPQTVDLTQKLDKAAHHRSRPDTNQDTNQDTKKPADSARRAFSGIANRGISPRPRLALGELRTLARLAQTDLLALHLARIARHEARRTQRTAQ